MLSKCVGGALSGHRVKLAGGRIAAVRSAATASRTDRGLAVSWRKGEDNVTTVPYVSEAELKSSPVIISTQNSSNNEGNKEESKQRHFYPELLLGFTLLSVASIFNNKDQTEQSKQQKDADDSSGKENRSNSLLNKFRVNAAEKFSGEGGEGGGGNDGNKKSRRFQYNFVADVVQETLPSIVHIEIRDPSRRNFYTGEPISVSNGSGFIVDSNGLILTNAHVVIKKPLSSIQVRLHNGETYVGSVEDVDDRSDLATVRIKCNNLPVMKLGTSSDVRPGEFVVAVGSPLSLNKTITFGVVSNVSRSPAEFSYAARDVAEYIQTDAAINSGNSGGPLINLDGEAVGLNSLKVTHGISFAIPIDHAKEFLKKSAERNKGATYAGRKRYIGITMYSLNPQIIAELRYRENLHPSVEHGILVYRLVAESPADKAGLQSGDVITHINNRPIYGSGDVYKILEGRESPLKLTVCRASKNNIILTVIPENL